VPRGGPVDAGTHPERRQGTAVQRDPLHRESHEPKDAFSPLGIVLLVIVEVLVVVEVMMHNLLIDQVCRAACTAAARTGP
jgi:hypothetical protein